MMPVSCLTNLPSYLARAIELGPLDYQRKLGQAMPTRPTVHRRPGRVGEPGSAEPSILSERHA